MKHSIMLCWLLLIVSFIKAQNVGIGIVNPLEKFTVAGTVLIDANNQHGGIFNTGNLLKFGTAGNVGIGSNKIAAPSLNGLSFYTNGTARMNLDSLGNVGINSDPMTAFRLTVNGNSYMGGLGIATLTPDLSFYKLDVNGSIRSRIDHFVNRDLWVDRNLDVDGTSSFFGNITASSNLTVGGNITVDGGRGLIRSTNSTQQVVAYPAGSVSYTNAPAGFSDDVEFVLPNVFSSEPRVIVAQVTNMSGTFERWTYTIHSVNISTHRFVVRFFNASSSSSTMQVTLNFIAIGAAS